jgi:hypothetical protein
VGRSAEAPPISCCDSRTGASFHTGCGFTGTLRGQARDTGIPGAANPTNVSITIDGNATVDGQNALPFSARVFIRASDWGDSLHRRNGRSATCSTIAVLDVD